MLRVVVLTCALAAAHGSAAAGPRGRIERIDHVAADDLPTIGPRHAPVTIELFADLGDSYSSGQLHLQLRELARRHPRNLRVVYRLCGRGQQASLPNQHLLIALEAHAAGRFFELVDAMYAGTLHSPRVDALAAIATRAGIAPARVAAALELGGPVAEAHTAALLANHHYRRRHGVRRVPGLLVNGAAYDRRPTSVDELEDLYDDALADAEARLADGVPLERLFETLVAERSRKAPEIAAGPLMIDGVEPGAAPPPATALVRLDPRRGEPIGDGEAPLVLTFFCNMVTRPCAAAAGYLGELTRAYPDEVRVVFRTLYDAKDADQAAAPDTARALWCAARQGKLEGMLELLARRGRPSRLPGDELDDAAGKLGVDLARFRLCRKAPQSERAVAAEVAAARREGIRHTPAVVIRGRVYLGTRSFDELRQLVDQALSPGVLGQMTAE